MNVTTGTGFLWLLAGTSEPGECAIIIDENTGNDEGFQECGDPLAGIIGDQHDNGNREVQHIPVPILL